jgi:deoxyxylulose-5-phosphate synthase
MLADALRHARILTVEDGVRVGGAGTFLVDRIGAMADEQRGTLPSYRNLGTPREFLAHANPEVILSELGLDAKGIAASVQRMIAGDPEPATPAAIGIKR